MDITEGFALARIVDTTQRLGDLTNGNATGDIDVRYSDSPLSLTAITLATNNGISAKRIFGVIIPDGNLNNILNRDQNTISDTSSFSFFPNPVRYEFTVSIADDLDSNCSIKIDSLEGKLIQTESIVKNLQNIKINSLHNGIYSIKIQNGKKLYHSKLIKS